MAAKLYSWSNRKAPDKVGDITDQRHSAHLFLKEQQESSQKDLEYKDLYASYKQVIQQSLIKKGLSVGEAEEITQEAFVRLLSLDEKQVPSYLKSYVYKIAHNLAVDRIRRNGCSPFVAPNQEVEEILDKQGDAPSPEESVQMMETLKGINKALQELPEKCRQAFYLYRVKGLGYPEVALMMDVSESMVRKNVLRAIRHCYDQLENEI